ncbi:hypothetical protein D3C71_1910860 [compost metagenome]
MEDRAGNGVDFDDLGQRTTAADDGLALRIVTSDHAMDCGQGHADSPSNIATARVQPADAPRILCGKQLIVKPVAGIDSRLCSFSKWQ